jgi:D-alanine-D-alanine ligase
MGGKSAEREVSLKSGLAVCNALKAGGHEVIPIDVGDDIARRIDAAQVDVAFIALHGKYGEDGTVQGMLELLGIPYTGSNVLTSALAMDKIMTKKVLLADSLPTPRFCAFSRPPDDEEAWDKCRQEVMATIGLPAVIKPATQGSSIGITFARSENAIVPGLQEAFRYDERVLVEEFIDGTEVTAAVLGNRHPRVLPLIEIVSATGVYNYQAKYTLGMSTHIIPHVCRPPSVSKLPHRPPDVPGTQVQGVRPHRFPRRRWSTLRPGDKYHSWSHGGQPFPRRGTGGGYFLNGTGGRIIATGPGKYPCRRP